MKKWTLEICIRCSVFAPKKLTKLTSKVDKIDKIDVKYDITKIKDIHTSLTLIFSYAF